MPDPQVLDPVNAPTAQRSSALRRLLTGTMSVTAALMVGNVLAYAVTLLAARLLAPAQLGELASLLAVFTLGSVPAVALQTIGAVRTSKAGHLDGLADGGNGTAALHGAALAVAGVTALVLLATGPLLVAVLDLSSYWPLVALAAATVPVNLAGIAIGRLQGAERFGAMAIAHGGTSVGKFGGAIGGLVLVGSPLAVFTGAFAGGMLAMVLAAALAGSARRITRPSAELLSATVDAGGAMLALLALVNADLLLAKALLPADSAGAYAVLAVLTKAAFWLPAAVTAVALPKLAKGHRGALPLALAATGVVGALLVVTLVPAGQLTVTAVGGTRYAYLGGMAWLFGAAGVLWSLVNVPVNARLAAGSRLIAPLLAGMLALECVTVVLFTGGSVVQIAATAAAIAALTLLVALRGRRRVGAAPAPVATPAPAPGTAEGTAAAGPPL